VSPAGVTIGIFTDVRAIGPVLYCIKVGWKRFVLDKITLFNGGVYFLMRIKNVAFEFELLYVRGTMELFGNFRSPGGVGLAVDVNNDVGEILALLRLEKVCYVILFEELEHLGAGFRIIKMDLISLEVEIGDFLLLKDGGNFLNSLNVCGLSRSGVRDFKNLVRFGVALRQVIQSGLLVPQVGSRFKLRS
jgi:hypothetical protein